MSQDNEKKFWVVAKPYNSAVSEGDAVGYFEHRRIKVGQKLQVTEQQFSDKWMQRIDGKAAAVSEEEVEDLKADARRRSKGAKPEPESVI